MIIRKFCAENFRNIKECELQFHPGVNLLYGNNAQGKTNAIEGIYMFARGKSFRAKEDKDLLGFDSEGFRVFIEFENKDGLEALEYAHFGKEKRRRRNGYTLKGAKELVGSFKAVLFYPDDLSLVKESPEERRSFLNVAISQCYPVYIDDYSRYKIALENRNCLLKSASKGFPVNEDDLDMWSYSMAEYASNIYIYRKEYIKKLELYANTFMMQISGCKESLSLIYKSDIREDTSDKEEIKNIYYDKLTRERHREKIVGTSLFGPHRDDMEININGVSARSFGSQGQQRSTVLSLKLAEGEVNKKICGEYPVFLFDDVLSELDDKRKEYILSGIGERQIIITSCERESFEIRANNVIEVNNGVYKTIR